MLADTFRLKAEELDYSVSPEKTALLQGGNWGDSVIGQPRALEALSIGTAIRAKGYNIFVMGSPGTGRRTAVMKTLSAYVPPRLELHDAVYVYNFSSPMSPVALSFKAGEATAFKKDVHSFVENIKKIVAMHAESGDVKKHKEGLEAEWEATENGRLAAFEAQLALDGFRILQVQDGEGQTTTDILPVRDGEPVPFEDCQTAAEAGKISPEDFASLRQRYLSHMDTMRLLFVELRRGRTSLNDRLETLRIEALKPLIHAESDMLIARYDDERSREWIRLLEKDVIARLYLFQPERRHKSPLARYGVNVLTERGERDKPPLIYEANPSYANLFGTLDHGSGGQGEGRAPYLHIRPGSIVKASGGFLIIQAEDLLADGEAWAALKRVLRTGTWEFQAQSGPMGQVNAIKPEPLELDVKIVLIGGEMTYDLLYNTDPDFQKLFKVCAEFDSTMPRNDESLGNYVSFARKITLEEGLAEPNAEGMAAIAEYGIRLAGHRNRLSTQFSRIADMIREADYRASRTGKDMIDAEAVTEAENSRSWLANLPEEKLADMIVSGEIILEASGSRVGRVNGLAVHDRGYYAFGLPAVISAQVSPGDSGVINIEGESGLSGEIYDKAVLIVEGFLRSHYARDLPLAISAGICFEQSYTAIEGDSASSTAIYALLSAIANVPLRQDIAVTGSVNQMGQIQAVGGIAEKVEGFYRLCKRRGLSGTQGVLIPRQNIVNLTISKDILEAIDAGEFSIYAISTIDEGIEVLTERTPGARDAQGHFPVGSFNGMVSAELLKMAKTLQEYRE
ncbi:MAG: AAA family ATPase [Spirochaetia bacterium]|jgi:lon-related putative ATP-dependent protease|nr:AAA family ATPase [Spirochaetia bacterium]